MNYDDKKLVHITHTVCKMFCDIADYTIIYQYKKVQGCLTTPCTQYTIIYKTTIFCYLYKLK